VCGVCADLTAKIWDLAAGVETRSLDGHPASVVSVRYSPASRLVYTASAYLVTVWDPRRSQCVHSLTSVSCCSLSATAVTCTDYTLFFQKILPPCCLHCNFFDPKLILVIFSRIMLNNSYNKMCVLFPFTTVLCTLITACSMNIQF